MQCQIPACFTPDFCTVYLATSTSPPKPRTPTTHPKIYVLHHVNTPPVYTTSTLLVLRPPFRVPSPTQKPDHTTGLYKSFSAGTIYTSQGTANLVKELIGVNAERVVALPMNRPVVVAGFELTLIDANHCPAAVM